MSKTCRSFPLGEEMWRRELQDHHRRLNTTKSTLRAAPPPPLAGSGSSSSRPATMGSRRPGGPATGGSANLRLKSPTGLTKAPPRGATAPAAAAAAGGEGGDNEHEGSQPRLKLEDLSESDREVCESMIKVLQKHSTADSKSLIEEMYVAAEMRRLLASYTGVYKDGQREAAEIGNSPKKSSSSSSAAAAATTTKRVPPRRESDGEGEPKSPGSPQGRPQSQHQAQRSTKVASPKTSKSHPPPPAAAAASNKGGGSNGAAAAASASSSDGSPSQQQQQQQEGGGGGFRLQLDSAHDATRCDTVRHGSDADSNHDSHHHEQQGGAATTTVQGGSSGDAASSDAASTNNVAEENEYADEGFDS